MSQALDNSRLLRLRDDASAIAAEDPWAADLVLVIDELLFVRDEMRKAWTTMGALASTLRTADQMTDEIAERIDTARGLGE